MGECVGVCVGGSVRVVVLDLKIHYNVKDKDSNAKYRWTVCLSICQTVSLSLFPSMLPVCLCALL